mgnify:CR=1 FL=1
MTQLDLAALIRPGDLVAWGQGPAEPRTLTRALVDARHRVGGRFGVFVGIGQGDALTPDAADCIDVLSYCGTGTNRALARAKMLDILPSHYSQFPALIKSGRLPVDVVLIQVSAADEQGRHSLGVAQEYLLAALDRARVVVAEINDQVPWVHGERTLSAVDFHAVVHSSRPLPELERHAPGPVEQAIAAHVAGLVEDGATVQMGLGAIPEAVLACLRGRRDLSVHSGTIGDAVAELMAQGVVTNARNPLSPGVTSAGMLMGTRRIFDFAHRNDAIRLRGTDYIHAPEVLARLERFTAVNSALEVDLTGQINSEDSGAGYVGAVGGAVDFLRGAHRSRGGLPIVALPSTARGASRIVARLNGPVTVPRSDAGLIVTEYGIADLRGACLTERTRRLVAIAHPDFREMLDRAAHGARLA